MENWFLLAFCILLSGTCPTFLKMYQKRNGAGYIASLLFTGIMTSMIALVCFIGNGFQITWNTTSFLLSVVMGLMYAVNMPLGTKAYSLGSIGMSGVFLSLGSLLIPFFYGVLFLPTEKDPTVLHWIGLATALCAILLQIPSRKDRNGMSLKFFLIGMCMFLINGSFCAIIKAQAAMPNPAPKMQVMFFAGLSGTIASFGALGILLLRKKRARAPSENTEAVESDACVVKDHSFKILMLPAIYGLFNAGVNLLNLVLGDDRLPAIVHYPLLSCGGLLLTTVLGVLVFRDRFTKRSALTLACCITTVILFAF